MLIPIMVNTMTYYAVPKKMAEILMSRGKLIWQPFLRIVYKAGKKKNDVLMDALLPVICNDPIVAVLLSRKTSLIKLSEKKPFPHGETLRHRINGEELLEMVKSAYVKTQELINKSYATFHDEMQLDIDWQRYRAIFVPTKRLIQRKKPIFKYLMGKSETAPYVICLFLKNLIKDGFKMTNETRVKILECEDVFYPLVITDGLIFYEPAWKLSESLTYNWVIRSFDKAKYFYMSVLERK